MAVLIGQGPPHSRLPDSSSRMASGDYVVGRDIDFQYAEPSDGKKKAKKRAKKKKSGDPKEGADPAALDAVLQRLTRNMKVMKMPPGSSNQPPSENPTKAQPRKTKSKTAAPKREPRRVRANGTEVDTAKSRPAKKLGKSSGQNYQSASPRNWPQTAPETASQEERARVLQFWQQLSPAERRELAKPDKSVLFDYIRDEREDCSCEVCSSKRDAVDEALEVLYSNNIERLEQYSEALVSKDAIFTDSGLDLGIRTHLSEVYETELQKLDLDAPHFHDIAASPDILSSSTAETGANVSSADAASAGAASASASSASTASAGAASAGAASADTASAGAAETTSRGSDAATAENFESKVYEALNAMAMDQLAHPPGTNHESAQQMRERMRQQLMYIVNCGAAAGVVPPVNEPSSETPQSGAELTDLTSDIIENHGRRFLEAYERAGNDPASAPNLLPVEREAFQLMRQLAGDPIEYMDDEFNRRLDRIPKELRLESTAVLETGGPTAATGAGTTNASGTDSAVSASDINDAAAADVTTDDTADATADDAADTSVGATPDSNANTIADTDVNCPTVATAATDAATATSIKAADTAADTQTADTPIVTRTAATTAWEARQEAIDEYMRVCNAGFTLEVTVPGPPRPEVSTHGPSEESEDYSEYSEEMESGDDALFESDVDDYENSTHGSSESEEETDVVALERSEIRRLMQGSWYIHYLYARVFEERTLKAYREHVARERQQSLLAELAEEEAKAADLQQRKQKEKDKKKSRKLAARQQREEEERKKAEEERRKAEIAKAKEEAHRLQQLEADRAKQEAHRRKIEERISQLALESNKPKDEKKIEKDKSDKERADKERQDKKDKKEKKDKKDKKDKKRPQQAQSAQPGKPAPTSGHQINPYQQAQSAQMLAQSPLPQSQQLKLAGIQAQIRAQLMSHSHDPSQPSQIPSHSSGVQPPSNIQHPIPNAAGGFYRPPFEPMLNSPHIRSLHTMAPSGITPGATMHSTTVNSSLNSTTMNSAAMNSAAMNSAAMNPAALNPLNPALNPTTMNSATMNPATAMNPGLVGSQVGRQLPQSVFADDEGLPSNLSRGALGHGLGNIARPQQPQPPLGQPHTQPQPPHTPRTQQAPHTQAQPHTQPQPVLNNMWSSPVASSSSPNWLRSLWGDDWSAEPVSKPPTSAFSSLPGSSPWTGSHHPTWTSPQVPQTVKPPTSKEIGEAVRRCYSQIQNTGIDGFVPTHVLHNRAQEQLNGARFSRDELYSACEKLNGFSCVRDEMGLITHIKL